MNEKLQEILDIDPSKEFLRFLVKRLQSENYRGVQISQHNRYTKEIVLVILEEIYKLCGGELLQIRTTDLSKRPHNINGEEKYAKLTNNIGLKIQRCTQDSLRKNIFVDMHRMGLICRFDKNKKELSPFARGVKKYISLSDFGIEFLKTKDIFTQNLFYTRALENLMNGFGEEILSLCLELESNYISTHELLFFGTFLYQILDSRIYQRSDILHFIKEYRNTSRIVKEALLIKIQSYCNPNNFSGDKTQKRDFHNWINETQQILTLLSQMAYFEWNKKQNKLYIRVGKDEIFEDTSKLKRSLNEKILYFEKHNIAQKTKGFELHHIVPLCFAKSKVEFHTIDKWQNLVYIDAYSHSQITQNKNANIILNFNKNDAIFSDLSNNQVYCENEKNIKYDTKKQDLMLDYNKELLNATDKT
ncbi:restriction endonuclease subunit R [Helicobacter sp. 16-1353]|uniref:restriction endonuclease subunit R n=1 Tax=Helicobacter sp. 16-1353 TaxID=2004996 RepID=UPI000DCE4EDB|nr:restriction endonuclease subunit R [Helicobacter sp. 16-1353]RAX54500.1 restriction endonuclease subunit R [Helicobacter sp. 16-1353]